MKLNLETHVKNLAGAAEPTTLGKQLASYLIHARGVNGYLATKYWTWSRDFFTGNPVTLDEADAKQLREFVDGHPDLPVWLKAQLTAALDGAVAAAKEALPA